MFKRPRMGTSREGPQMLQLYLSFVLGNGHRQAGYVKATRAVLVCLLLARVLISLGGPAREGAAGQLGPGDPSSSTAREVALLPRAGPSRPPKPLPGSVLPPGAFSSRPWGARVPSTFFTCPLPPPSSALWCRPVSSPAFSRVLFHGGRQSPVRCTCPTSSSTLWVGSLRFVLVSL